MIIAIPVWNNSVSSVCDFAACLLVVEIQDGKETGRSEIPFNSSLLPQRALLLKKLGVDILVCGAVSRTFAEMIAESGIELLAYINGSIDDVLEAYKTGKLEHSRFAMPGCWQDAGKDFGQCGQGRRRCRRQGKQGKYTLKGKKSPRWKT